MSDAVGKMYTEFFVDLTDVSPEEIGALRWWVDLTDREIMSRLPEGDYDRRFNICKELVRKLEGALGDVQRRDD